LWNGALGSRCNTGKCGGKQTQHDLGFFHGDALVIANPAHTDAFCNDGG
jgi:hypothetical protein